MDIVPTTGMAWTVAVLAGSRVAVPMKVLRTATMLAESVFQEPLPTENGMSNATTMRAQPNAGWATIYTKEEEERQEHSTYPSLTITLRNLLLQLPGVLLQLQDSL